MQRTFPMAPRTIIGISNFAHFNRIRKRDMKKVNWLIVFFVIGATFVVDGAVLVVIGTFMKAFGL